MAEEILIPRTERIEPGELRRLVIAEGEPLAVTQHASLSLDDAQPIPATRSSP